MRRRLKTEVCFFGGDRRRYGGIDLCALSRHLREVMGWLLDLRLGMRRVAGGPPGL